MNIFRINSYHIIQFIAATSVGVVVSCVVAQDRANAVSFTNGGITYDITAVNGSFDSLSPQLTSNFFFNNPALASSVSSSVKTQLGTQTITAQGGQGTATYGALFAYNFTPGIVPVASSYAYATATQQSVSLGLLSSQSFSYAIATPQSATSVPEPMNILGTLMVAGALLATKRKLTLANKAVK